MGKYKKEDRKRIYQSRRNDTRPRRRNLISVFRPLLLTPELTANVETIQTDIEQFVEDLGLGRIQRVALDGLRVTLLPSHDVNSIGERIPTLNNPAKVRKRIREELKLGEETLPNVKPKEGLVTWATSTLGRGALVGYNYDDPRLMGETMDVRKAIFAPYGPSYKPFMALCYTPELERREANELFDTLRHYLPTMTASFAPIEFGR